MLSKPLAALLLVAALCAAALAGGYIATKTLTNSAESQESPDELVPVEPPEQNAAGAAKASGAAAARGGGGVSRPSIPKPPAGAPGSVGAPQGPGESAAVSPARHSGEGTPTFEEVEVPAGQLLDLQLQSPLSSETAKVEDRVEARITKDVKVGTAVAIPAGAKVLGSVTRADKGGRLTEPARLGVLFHTLVVTGAPEVPLVIDPLMHEGPSPAGDSKAKIGGGAAAGAAVGWLKGGLAGAIKGGAVGGAAGTTMKMVQGRKPAELPAGAQARVELRAATFVTVQR